MAYNRFRTSIRAFIGLAAVMAVASAAGQASGGSVAAKYPAGSIASVEAADSALAEAAIERDAAERRYATEQSNCYSKFFATSCMDEARERRRKALADIRAVEVQANEFKRRERAAERDREVAQRKADSEAKLAEREKQLQQQREAGRTVGAKTVSEASKSSRDDAASSAAGKQDRTAQHEAKLKRIQAEEAANAAKRAENIAAYERKQQEAEKHLKEVESRKAEKEREKARIEEEERLDREKRENDFENWVAERRANRQVGLLLLDSETQHHLTNFRTSYKKSKTESVSRPIWATANPSPARCA